MALKDQIITIAEIREYRDLDAGFDPVRFNGFLQEVQNVNLQDLLGPELWYDLFTNIGVAKYVTLINGEAYTVLGETVYYPGLKPFLIWAWLSKMPSEGDVHHTQSGEVSYLREVTRTPSSSALNYARENYKKNMMIERNKIIKYLNEKNDIYPLWDDKSEKKITNLQFDII